MIALPVSFRIRFGLVMRFRWLKPKNKNKRKPKEQSQAIFPKLFKSHS